ncbi:hypothetical protein N566_24545 [Streptomycetaceae bacterium MP113-05]|nr:hypothetical protein N566_24545 [Streptomycetaceae bacterium MP113-05]
MLDLLGDEAPPLPDLVNRLEQLLWSSPLVHKSECVDVEDAAQSSDVLRGGENDEVALDALELTDQRAIWRQETVDLTGFRVGHTHAGEQVGCC